jgi:mycothiol synthase
MTAGRIVSPMHRAEITRADGDIDRDALNRLLDAAAAADGAFPLSDHLRLELEHGGRPGFAAVTIGSPPVGYAQLAAINDVHTVELVIDPERRDDPSLTTDLLAAAVDIVAGDGGGVLQWWAFDAGPADDAAARSVGLTPSRTLHQMRRPLPTGLAVDVSTRAFVPGRDEESWLAVNNRAFAGHPDQGGWTADTLRQRQAEPWFDPSGFLLHEREGRLAAFCWTKVHGDAEPALGEIYVIAVDPDFHGLGLGTQLTLAGLASLAERGIGVGMLYVDAANRVAVAMYERLGFAVHRTDRAYAADVPSVLGRSS